uniref:Uncharacterized protein n=1 Tax=Bos taurus TaxID=9913 RepID=A0ABI0P563_BOVIN
GNQEATAAKKSSNAVCFKGERTKEDPLSTEIQRQCEGTEYDHEGQKTSKRNLEKEIRSYATQSKKVKKTRKPNCFFCSCARKKLNQSRKGYQNMRQSQRRRQNQKRRLVTHYCLEMIMIKFHLTISSINCRGQLEI